MRWDDLPKASLLVPDRGPKGYLRDHDVRSVSMHMHEPTTLVAEWTAHRTLLPGDLVDVDTERWVGEARVVDVEVDYSEPGHPRTMLRLEDARPF